jgi:hypothetical protein|tara:strand:+ start:983 stop:1315 length:333 start_codon:yes stop_codon:yes gene_type:complete
MNRLLLTLAVILFCSFKIPSKGLVVIHYNASFNTTNSVSLTGISDAKVLSLWIDDPDVKEFGKIKSVPTIVLYKNGKEIDRWEPGLSLTLSVTHKDIQEVIDELTGANKF